MPSRFGYLQSLFEVSNLEWHNAIWAGVGTALVAILGVFLFNESASWVKGLSIALIIFGVVGLHLADRMDAFTQ